LVQIPATKPNSWSKHGQRRVALQAGLPMSFNALPGNCQTVANLK
jgi:hypothetical protein